MKAIIMERFDTIRVTLKPIAVLIFLIFIFCMISLIVVRQQCVRKGYEISRLSSELEMKNVEFERLSREYSEILRTEALIDKAVSLGFIFPKSGRVFYVRK